MRRQSIYSSCSCHLVRQGKRLTLIYVVNLTMPADCCAWNFTSRYTSHINYVGIRFFFVRYPHFTYCLFTLCCLTTWRRDNMLTLLTSLHPMHTGRSKTLAHFCTPWLYQILTDFQIYFTVRIRREKFIVLPLKIAPHLTYVATLPCEISLSSNQ